MIIINNNNDNNSNIIYTCYICINKHVSTSVYISHTHTLSTATSMPARNCAEATPLDLSFNMLNHGMD